MLVAGADKGNVTVYGAHPVKFSGIPNEPDGFVPTKTP